MNELLIQFIEHPLSFFLAVGTSIFAVYLVFKIAQNVSKDLRNRNQKLGFKPSLNRTNAPGVGCEGILLVALLAYIGAWFLFTWLGSMLPFQIGL